MVLICIDSTNKNELNDLPNDMEHLFINNLKGEVIPSLKNFKNLKRINIEYSEIIEIPEFPENLEKIHIHACKFIQQIEKMPDSLKLLYICWSNISILPNCSNKDINICVSYNTNVNFQNKFNNYIDTEIMDIDKLIVEGLMFPDNSIILK